MAVIDVASQWGSAVSLKDTQGEPEILMESVPCPGCAEMDFEPILKTRDHLTRYDNEFGLVRCTACDLVFTNPRPEMPSLGYFYPDHYSPYHAEGASRSSWWINLLERSALQSYYGYPRQPAGPWTRFLGQLGLRKFESRRKRHDWIPYRSGGRLLDVGCGSGVFLERMRDFGWDTVGLELAADVAQRVERRTGIRIHIGTLPHPDLTSQSFDAVTLWHVLEHVPEPKELLKSAAELLVPQGLLVIEVPNIESWSFTEFGPHWVGLELPRHLQHFSPDTLAAMLPKGIFRNIEVQQIGMRSLMKQSIERAVNAGSTRYAGWLKKGKAFWTEQANRTESDCQADVIRLVAEKI